jgi:hypothetical protein
MKNLARAFSCILVLVVFTFVTFASPNSEKVANTKSSISAQKVAEMGKELSVLLKSDCKTLTKTSKRGPACVVAGNYLVNLIQQWSAICNGDTDVPNATMACIGMIGTLSSAAQYWAHVCGDEANVDEIIDRAFAIITNKTNHTKAYVKLNGLKKGSVSLI